MGVFARVAGSTGTHACPSTTRASTTTHLILLQRILQQSVRLRRVVCGGPPPGIAPQQLEVFQHFLQQQGRWRVTSVSQQRQVERRHPRGWHDLPCTPRMQGHGMAWHGRPARPARPARPPAPRRSRHAPGNLHPQTRCPPARRGCAHGSSTPPAAPSAAGRPAGRWVGGGQGASRPAHDQRPRLSHVPCACMHRPPAVLHTSRRHAPSSCAPRCAPQSAASPPQCPAGRSQRRRGRQRSPAKRGPCRARCTCRSGCW